MLRDISEASGVPVLPATINEMIESLVHSIPTVGYCCVPGAGGFDAVLVVGVDDSQAGSLVQVLDDFAVGYSSA